MRWDAPSGVAEGDRFCEHDNETSKTDVPRVMCVVAKTRGPAAIDLGGALEDYWKACSFDIITSQEGGWVGAASGLLGGPDLAAGAAQGRAETSAALRRE